MNNTPYRMIWMLELLCFNEVGEQQGTWYWTFTTKELAIDWALSWIKKESPDIDLESRIKQHGKEAVMQDYKSNPNGEPRVFGLERLKLYGDIKSAKEETPHNSPRGVVEMELFDGSQYRREEEKREFQRILDEIKRHSPVCGGNTSERVEEQIEWLEKVAEKQKNNETS